MLYEVITAFQVFLVFHAGFPEMHLRVDDTGQNMEPGGVEPAFGGGARQIADRGDPAAADAHVGGGPARWGHANAAVQDQSYNFV